jgi:hypothetical protein
MTTNLGKWPLGRSRRCEDNIKKNPRKAECKENRKGSGYATRNVVSYRLHSNKSGNFISQCDILCSETVTTGDLFSYLDLKLQERFCWGAKNCPVYLTVSCATVTVKIMYLGSEHEACIRSAYLRNVTTGSSDHANCTLKTSTG